MKAAEFSDIAQGIASIATFLGIIIGGQLRFGKIVKEGSWTPADSSGPMVILPGISLRCSYVYHVPTTIAFVLLHGKMKYDRGAIEDLRADRVVKISAPGTTDLPNY
jgi:hypothetical protein